MIEYAAYKGDRFIAYANELISEEKKRNGK